MPGLSSIQTGNSIDAISMSSSISAEPAILRGSHSDCGARLKFPEISSLLIEELGPG